jgi:FAD-linked sulfhydryl oxidase
MQLYKRIALITALLFGTIIGLIYTLDTRSINNLSPKAPFFEHAEELSAPIMSRMGNETAKAILGNAAWHLLHTMSVKYPLHPTNKNQKTFVDFIENFSVLYPCGDCARHFQILLKKNPPKTLNREEVVKWTCDVHNLVNERLGKTPYDCSTVQENYSCGCDPDELL